MKPYHAKVEGICAIVPVNVLHVSKARLSSHLDERGRSRISAAMLLDVLRTLQKVKRIRRITVVSADFGVRRIARQLQVHFLWEGKRRGLNKGVQLALREARRRKFSAVLIVPSDIPLVTLSEIRRFLRLSDGYSIALTPSKDGLGTNALFLRPPGIIRPAFGKNSFRRHLSMAKRKSFSARVVRSKRIELDVDEPADLASLKRLSLRNETGRFLRMMN